MIVLAIKEFPLLPKQFLLCRHQCFLYRFIFMTIHRHLSGI